MGRCECEMFCISSSALHCHSFAIGSYVVEIEAMELELELYLRMYLVMGTETRTDKFYVCIISSC
jgi:hypothetical protein